MKIVNRPTYIITEKEFDTLKEAASILYDICSGTLGACENCPCYGKCSKIGNLGDFIEQVLDNEKVEIERK